jgi:hypothetical protein
MLGGKSHEKHPTHELPPELVEGLAAVQQAAAGSLEQARKLANAPWLKRFMGRYRFLFRVAGALEAAEDRALAGQARRLDQLILGEAIRLTFTLWRAIYWAALLAFLAPFLPHEDEAEELEAERSSEEREEPPPRPVVTATVTLKTISPTAPNATA